MRKQAFSGKNIVVSLGFTPLIGLAPEDDAVMVEYQEDNFDDPVIDLSGQSGAHVELTARNVLITVKVSPTATTTIAFLNGFDAARQAAPAMSGTDITSQTKSFSAQDVVLKKTPPWSGGKRPQVLEYVFSAITCKINHGGPRILPV